MYTGFAGVYDDLVGAPYDEWAGYVCEIWRRHGVAPGLVCDLACGTGEIARRLAAAGYDMIGIDLSADMLAVARGKDQKTLYLQQDMRRFELYGTVGAITCLCDSLNYLLKFDDLVRVFGLVQNYLDPGGVFIFDINTEHKYEAILAENIFAHNGENAAYIWENSYNPHTRRNLYDLTLFARQNNGLFVRHNERHIQRAYGDDEIRQAISAAGLRHLATYNELTFDPPDKNAQRVYYACKK